MAWLPGGLQHPFLRLIKCVVPGLGGVDVCPPKAKVTRSNRVGCASIILSGIFAISTLTENSRCHHSVTDNFKLAKAARGSFLVTRPQRPR